VRCSKEKAIRWMRGADPLDLVILLREVLGRLQTKTIDSPLVNEVLRTARSFRQYCNKQNSFT
jgi:hypothetical protein